jgi:hypothetical protein
MTTRNPAPPLPHPQAPAAAAHALRDAAQTAAYTWARPTGTARHSRAIGQIYSTLRDLGIATRGLARYQIADPGPVSAQFTQQITVSARRLLDAWEHLDGELAAEGLGTLPDDSEPGTVLCRAARNAILAWRQPEGTAADRNTTVEHLTTAIWFLAIGALNLAGYAPRRRTIKLRAVANGLAEVAACLTQAIQAPAHDPAPGQDAAPARHGGERS